jgi:hypothetical protein
VKAEIVKNYNFKIKKLEKTIKDKFPEIGVKISYDEAWEVIKNMKDSSPGNNGLTVVTSKSNYRCRFVTELIA